MLIFVTQNVRMNSLQPLEHTLVIPVCCPFVSRCAVALRTMEIPPFLYCLLEVFFLLHNLGFGLTENTSIVQPWILLFSCIVVGFTQQLIVYPTIVISVETCLLSRCLAADGS
jgi:hypothetical protein